MKPVEFIAIASKLADSAESGASGYRSAVSRAYYGAYLTVLHFVSHDLAIPCKSKDGKSEHQMLQRYLMGCKVPQAVELGQSLSNLHESRKEADYEMDELQFEDQEESKICIERAMAIIADLSKCSSQVRQQIKAGIVQYRRDMKISV